jgi:hypothetical protein
MRAAFTAKLFVRSPLLLLPGLLDQSRPHSKYMKTSAEGAEVPIWAWRTTWHIADGLMPCLCHVLPRWPHLGKKAGRPEASATPA